jgi:ABC-type phosphate transport system permease subunit
VKVLLRIAIVLVLAAALLPAVAAACPDCKDAVSDQTPGGSADLGRGFYWSILLMIGVPFAAVATVAGLILRSQLRRRREGRESTVPRLLPSSREARP